MKNPTQFRKAFTLLEVLIATSIFAVVMVMTTGVIAQSTNYQSKTTALRSASEEAARISDAISRDLKMAEGSFNIIDQNIYNYQFKSGVALSSGSHLLYNVAYSDPSNTSGSMADYNATAIIVNTKDSILFYINGVNMVYFKTYTKTSLSGTRWNDTTKTLILQSSIYPNLIDQIINEKDPATHTIPVNRISSSDLETTVAFSGYVACSISAFTLEPKKAQSYVAYYVHSKTKDFTTLSPNNRAEAYLRSMVTMRNYAN